MATSPSSRPGEHLTAVLDDPAFYLDDPFPHYARMRAEAPVAWNAGLGYWALTRHAEVMAVSRDSDLFCSGKGILTFEIGVDYPFPPTMMHTDPPEHTRYRNLVSPAFRPSIIRAVEDSVRARAVALVDTIEAGVPFDFTERIAIPLPIQVIADYLGIPASKSDRFFEWSEASIPGSNDWSAEYRAELQAEMRAYLLELTLSRRGQEGNDVTSVLANTEVDGESLTDEQIVMFQNQLLVAGNETTRNMLSAGLWEMAVNPDQWARLVAEPALIPSAVEEFLRWSSPVIAFMRTATRDTELAGVAIAAGDPLLMLYSSANRDEAEFGPTAAAFDIGRSPNHHVAFGFGAHFCIGAALARLEGRVLLEELIARFGSIATAGTIERTPSPIIAGVKHCPIVLS